MLPVRVVWCVWPVCVACEGSVVHVSCEGSVVCVLPVRVV